MSLPSLPDSALAAINTGRHDDFTLCAEALKPIIAESEILRVYRFPWDGFPGVIVELDPKVDLKSLAVKADSLVSHDTISADLASHHDWFRSSHPGRS